MSEHCLDRTYSHLELLLVCLPHIASDNNLLLTSSVDNIIHIGLREREGRIPERWLCKRAPLRRTKASLESSVSNRLQSSHKTRMGMRTIPAHARGC